MNVKLIKYKSNGNSVCLLAISVRRHVMCEVVGDVFNADLS